MSRVNFSSPHGPTAGLNARVTLNDAQIKALPSGAVVIAHGIPGVVIQPIAAALTFKWAADYTNIDPAARLFLSSGPAVNGWTIINYGIGGGGQIFNNGGDFMVTPGTGGLTLLNGTADATDIGQIRGADVLLTVDNAAAGNFTGGDPANRLTITLFYNTLAF